MKKIFTKDKNLENLNYIFWIGLLLIMLFRFFYFGINYYNYLDDYNTYGIFNRRNDNIWHNIILWYKLYTFRPFAFFCDSYITQWFWDKMWLVLLFYTVMHFFTVYIFYKIMEKCDIKFGAFGIIITSITPLIFEGVYWIAASTRLVSGMFFSISSLYFLIYYTNTIKNKFFSKLYLFLYVFLNIISIGFYEQIIVFNLVFTIIIIYLKKDRITSNFKLIILTPIISTLLISLYYIFLAPYGKVKIRGEIATNLILQLKKVTLYIGNMLIKVNYDITTKSFFDGTKLIKNIWQIGIILFVIIYSMIIFLALYKEKILQNNYIKYNNKFNMILGIILTIVPFAPFYILKESFIYERAVYPSIFGIGLFLDSILNIKTYKNKFIYPLISVIFILPFFIANISRVNDMKLIEKTDNKIMANLLEEFKKSEKDEKTTVILFNTKRLYSKVSNKRLENITSSDWALIGKANSDSTDFYFKTMIPIGNKEILYEKYLNNNYILFGIDDNLNIYRLHIENDRLLIKENNLIFGYLNKNEENDFIFTKLS